MELTNEQLEERKKAIFSTDAAAALGIGKYSTPVQVWMEKIGKPMESTPTDNEYVRMGHVMQPVIARLYEDKQHARLKDLSQATVYHPTHAYMASHFDYVTADNSTLVECKNFHSLREKEFGPDGSDDVPEDCLVQCIHEALCYGVTRVDLAVLFGGQKFRVYPITVDPEFADIIVQREGEFWKSVVEKRPPKPSTREEACLLFPSDSGRVMIADKTVSQAVRELATLREQISAAEKLEESLLARIQGAMGDATTLVNANNEKLATWKLSKPSKRVDVAALKEAGLYDKYCVEGSASRRFLLKV